jgi:hypothetical protein
MTSARGAVGDAGQAVEASGIGRHDDSPTRNRGGCDHQVVRSSRLANTPHVGEQLAMAARDIEVVVLDRHVVDDGVDELLPCDAAPPVSELDPDEKLGDRDRRDGDVVIVGD